ncbi:hypothetical protein LOD99_4347 [Oopsacas minuta]|uniref:Sulfatase N-terminal domain-containing protein n=1 Tax=Oopsacas minuta TaxID=111878 RepID=A0AAV7JUI2_9METZ|nr:hypothetical protein LOD99_4347 [Oopsacas minuta]
MGMRLFAVFITLTEIVVLTSAIQPNIVFILADDLGYYDVGYHGKSVLTPTINNLTADGVRLEQYYTQPICTATRASLMTGRYPIHLGFQKIGSINIKSALGLPLNFTLLPERLRELGYTTHGIGKWHLGYYNPKYLPTNRGFDSFFGYYGADLHYFTHTSYDLWTQPPPNWCLDLHNNSKCVPNYNGTYSLDLYIQEAERIIQQHSSNTPMFMYLAMQNIHNPIEVPKEFEHLYYDVRSIDRRKTLGMVTALDYSIAKLVNILKQKDGNFWDNTVLVFASDNGGWPIPDGQGSNYPLRGSKLTYFEGGIRVPAFIHSPLIKNPGRIESSLFHVSDWYPTLVSLAGGSVTKDVNLDGVNQWDVISEGMGENMYPPRSEILHNLQLYDGRYVNGAIRLGKWKLLTGAWANCTIESYPPYCFWTPPPEFNTAISYSFDTCESMGTSDYQFSKETNPSSYIDSRYGPVTLFDLEQDPYERYDVQESYPNVVELLIERLDSYLQSVVDDVQSPWEADKWEKAAKAAGCLAPWDFD